MLNLNPYRGTRDFYPSSQRVLDYIFEKMTETAKLFGFEHYNGPLLEDFDLYAAKSGEELVNTQIYKLVDQGERLVAIRPEMTPTLARMVAKIYKEEKLPLRWYSIPNLMRYERPQKGRLREHWQFNCDIIGGTYPFDQIEILKLIYHLFEIFKGQEFISLRINNRYILDAILKHITNEPLPFYKGIDRYLKDKSKLNELINNLDAGKKDILNKYLDLKSFDEAINLLTTLHEDELSKQISKFNQALTQSKLKTTFDPFIVRGLDYYTGTVFEVFDMDPENPRALCGGGSYNNLLKIFGENEIPSFGFGLGDVTLTSFLENHKLLPPLESDHYILLTSNDVSNAFILADTLRKNGFNTLVNLNTTSFNKSFNIAKKRMCKLLIHAESLLVKNLLTNEQSQFLDINQMLSFLRNK